jgi:uncharacterized protein YndB with AHSA1/START domain
MRLLRIALGVMAVLFGLFILVGLLLPERMEVGRSIRVDAPPAEVFPLVNDLRQFNRWSPWTGGEAGYEYSGPDAGAGQRMSWRSDDPQVGSGSQEIVASRPNQEVDMRLDFGPQGTADAAFYLEPSDGGTLVTWTFGYDVGDDLIGRYIGLIMKGMVGDKYQEGLARLKRLVETGSP